MARESKTVTSIGGKLAEVGCIRAVGRRVCGVSLVGRMSWIEIGWRDSVI